MTTTISPAEFEKAVARACLRAIQTYPPARVFAYGDESAVHYGANTATIASEARVSVSMARRRLLKLKQDGKLLCDDRRGGRATWWPVGLAAQHAYQEASRLPPAAPPAALARQAFTAPVPARQHWSDVLGVPRDCSTSEARAAFQSAVAALDQTDPDYPNQSRRVRDAIDACCRDHEIQIEE